MVMVMVLVVEVMRKWFLIVVQFRVYPVIISPRTSGGSIDHVSVTRRGWKVVFVQLTGGDTGAVKYMTIICRNLVKALPTHTCLSTDKVL